MRCVLRCGLAALAILLSGSAARAAPLDVRLLVEETGGVARPSSHVRSGVPLGKSAGVTDARRLYLLARDEEGKWKTRVPLQARITSRWGGTADEAGKPAKWVLLDFPCAVPDRGTAEFRLRYAAGAPSAGEGPGGHLVEDRGDRFRVDTGRLRFEVRKDGFGLLGKLSVLVPGPGGAGEWVEVTGRDPLDVVLADGNGVEYRASRAPPREVRIEEDGPLSATILVRGGLADPDGGLLMEGWVGYTFRLRVHAGSRFVRMFFTLENNGFYGLEADWSVRDNTPKWLFFDRLSLDLRARIAGRKTVALATVPRSFGLEEGESLRLLQRHVVRPRAGGLDDESKNFLFDVRIGPREVFRGDRARGAVSVRRGEVRITAGVRDFWRNHPKAISVRGDTLSLALWPTEGVWPENRVGRKAGTYQFEGGRWKTHEIGLAFGSDPEGGPDAFATALDNPLFARAPASYCAATGAIDHLAPERFTIGNRATAYALDRLNQMQEACVDVTRAEPQPRAAGAEPQVPPISIPVQRERRGNAFRVARYDLGMYGWFSYGDLPGPSGWCSLHHDWPYGMLLQYLRHEGKREFLDIAESMVRHRYDIDQYHNRDTRHRNWYYFNGFQRFDEGWHGDYDRGAAWRSERTPGPGSTWLRGLLLHHALTGDMRSLETARENADAFYRYFRRGVGVTERRIPIRHDYELKRAGMAIGNLLDFYSFTGEERYRRMAEDIYRNQVAYSEELYGSNGFFDLRAHWDLGNVVLILGSLRKLHRVTGDPEVLALLTRILLRLKEIYLDVSGYAKLGRYMPLQLPTRWVGGHAVGTEVLYDFLTADAYAYVYLATGEPGFLEFARRLFRDSVVYFQAGEQKLVPPDFDSAVSYNPRRYAGMETTADAWVLRGHQVYLYAEWLLSRKGAPRFRFPNDDFRISGGAKLAGGGKAPSGGRTADVTPPGVSIEAVEAVSGAVTVVFTTDEPTTARVEYGPREGKTSLTPRAAVASLTHRVVIAGLDPNRSYVFRVHARDLAENETITGYRPLITVKDRTPPRIVRVTCPDEKTVRVEFSEPVLRPGAERVANWSISPPVGIARAAPDPSGRIVTLLTDRLLPDRKYGVRVEGIRDRATPPNALAGPGVEAPRPFFRDVVADEAGPAFRVMEGDWGQTTTELDAWGGTARFCLPGVAEARAGWRVPVPETGWYEVYAWWPKLPPSRRAATRAAYRIRHDGGVSTVSRDQRSRGGRWVLLGTWRFRREDGVVVEIGNRGAQGTVFADALRLVYTLP